MDGPSITGSGGEIGSAWVTIGGDLTGLRAAEAEAKAITERIGQMMTGTGSIGNPINGAGSIGGGLTLTVKIDEQAIHGQLDKAIANYAPKALTIPVQLDMSGVSAQLQSIGVSGGGSVGGAVGGGAINGGSAYRGRNPLSTYGIASRLGMPLLAAFGAEEIATLGAGLAEAGNIGAHPERILRGYDEIGAQFDYTNDPIIRQSSATLASIGASRRRLSAFGSIPVVGSFIGAGAALFDTEGSFGDAEYAAKRAASVEMYDLQIGRSEALRAATLGGDLGQIAEASLAGNDDFLRRRAAPLASLRARAAQLTAPHLAPIPYGGESSDIQAARARGMVTDRLEDVAPELAAQLADAEKAQKELDDKVNKNNRIATNRAKSIQGAISSSYEIGAESARIRGAAYDMIGNAPGAQLAFMDQMHTAEMLSFDSQTQQMVAVAKPVDQEGLRQQRLQQRSEQEKKYQADRAQVVREGEQQISAIESQADAARLRARHQNFDAELKLFNDRVNREMQAVKGSPDEARRAAAFNAEGQAMIDLHNEQIRNAFGEAGVGFANSMIDVQAANLRMQGRGREAELLLFGRQRNVLQERLRQQFSQLNFGNIGEVLPGIIGTTAQIGSNEANAQAAQFEDQRYLALSSYAIGARGSAADSRINNQPINAQSINAVTRAQLELANADPRERAALRATLAKELQAQEHDLMGFRSGDMAIDSGLAGSIGLAGGLDLRGVGADRRAAAKTFEQGINDINSGKVVGNGQDNKQLSAMLNVLQQILKTIANKSGISMFN